MRLNIILTPSQKDSFYTLNTLQDIRLNHWTMNIGHCGLLCIFKLCARITHNKKYNVYKSNTGAKSLEQGI